MSDHLPIKEWTLVDWVVKIYVTILAVGLFVFLLGVVCYFVYTVFITGDTGDRVAGAVALFLTPGIFYALGSREC